ncbi:hypothetical protein BCR36DRAFT_332548 [Piromyces finnis]|uniref:Coth-domain-containing protein n=1 Tax=Piromyces finnis TaxID=1754191 RepID=A0A1Y1V346_9FUNG|nr:hypothetical protein BCR36DRAFT_332548 [Piromyces finnis]|eukprot:ORX46006.1 hypothetical protein BCR36DRAFT_332548 [Piromyces finnis]
MKNNFKEFNFSNDIILNKQLLEYNPSINITHIIDVFQNKFQHTTDKQVKIYNKISNVFSPIEKYDILYSKKYKTKNSSMVVELNGTYNNSKIEKFKEMTVKVGGRSSNEYGKPCINIKIRGKKNLYGRKQFKLRPGARDATYLRSKLACDIHNRLGLPSISANYITLYINDEYIGLYILMDSIKPSWIEYVFGEKNTSTLYKCENLPYGLNEQSYKGCPNENENVTNHSEWKNFLSTIEQAKKADDVENILDIDLFLKEIALEYLFGSWDHYPTSDHNFYFYKANDNKWKYLIYDFDAEFGQDLNKITNMSIQEDENRQINYDLFQYSKDENKDYTKQSFVDWIGSSKSNLINILIINNPERFVSILKEIVSKSFNPAILFPHIDELKKIIKPYVQKDKEPDINGKYPGQFNASVKIYSVAQWDANSEYTTIYNFLFDTEAYGLKYWILSKYRYICQALGMNCDSNYINDFKYSIKTDVRNKYINPFNDNNLKHWNDDL